MPTFSLSWTVKDTEQIVSVRALAERVINDFSAIRIAAAQGCKAEDESTRFMIDDTPGAQWSMTIVEGDHTEVYVSYTNTLGPTIHLTVKKHMVLVAQYTIMPNQDNPQKDNWRFVVINEPNEQIPSDSPRIDERLDEISFWLTQLVSVLADEKAEVT